jgi:alpha-glucosidase (family GH31 glycosyl hydrolase)
MRSRAALLASFGLLATGCSSRSAGNGSPSIAPVLVLSSPDATVTIHTAPFAMQVASSAGDVLLDSFPTSSAVPGDTSHAYGPLGITHRTTHIETALIEGWDHQLSSDDPWTEAGAVTAATCDTAHCVLTIAPAPGGAPLFHLELALQGPELKVDGTPLLPGPAARSGDDAEPGWNEWGQAFKLASGDHFLGLGERFVSVDHRGRNYYDWVEEGGLGGGEHADAGPTNPSPNGPSMTYLPVPFLLSSRGYALWLDTTRRTGFALGSDTPDAFRFYAVDGELHYRVLVHDQPRDTLAHYTSLTGRASLPAPWVFGPRRRVDHGSMVQGMPEETALRKLGVPTTMLDDTTHFLPAASEQGRQSTLSAWTAQMHALGYKAIGYYNPHVSVADPNATDLLSYGRAHDLFVRLASGGEFDTTIISAGSQTVATIDLSNPAAVDWFGTILQRALDLGYDGWMLDFGEYLPVTARMADGRSGWEAHNDFPRLVQKATFDYLTKVRGDDFMFFARSGYTGTQAYVPVVWSGDPSASFDDTRGLPANVRAGINAGLSGIPFWGSDISGFTCLNDPPADKEVYLRWAEFGALSSDMHDENACSAAPPGAPPKWTLWSDAETTQVYGQYAALHTRLNPYLHAAAREATQDGMPVLRHPVFDYASSPDAWTVELEYGFGPALYVAPVVRRGQTSRTFWLPPGKWVDWWTLSPVAGGGTITRDAPLDVIPVYLRSGGIVPMLDPSVQTIAPDQDDTVVSAPEVAGVLDVRAAIDPATTSAQMTLTDGTTLTVGYPAAGVQLPAGLAAAQAESDLATCNSCGRVDPLPAGAQRVRITTASEPAGIVVAGGLLLAHGGGTRKVRWDVIVLP